MQTSYDEKMDVAVVGQMVDCTNRRVESKFATGPINAGGAVQIVTDTTVVATAASVYGVAIQHPLLTLSDSTGEAAYADGDGVSILTQGRIWVQVDGAVAINGQAYWDVAADAFNSTATDNFIVTNGRFKSSTTGAGLAILEIV